MAIGDMPGAAIAYPAGSNPTGLYQRHRPEQSLLYQIVAQHYPTFRDLMEAQGKELPTYVQREFDYFLKCGRLEHGFLRVRCDDCQAEHLVAFSCKRRGFCPSCGARRMTESAALLVDDVLPHQPIRQWVLSFPFQLRYLFANRPALMGQVLLYPALFRTAFLKLIRCVEQRFSRIMSKIGKAWEEGSGFSVR